MKIDKVEIRIVDKASSILKNINDKLKDKPVIIAKGKLVASGRPFQYILHNGKKKFLWGDNCIKVALLLFMSLTSCSDFIDDDYRRVDPALETYIQVFKVEAKTRGIIVDDSRLKLYFGKTKNGIAATTDHSLNSITVDSTTVNWRVNPEEVIYHEFGHLLLHRDHTDFTLTDTVGNVVPGSIMSTKASVKYTKLPTRRQYYIDELFNPKTPKPLWAN